MNNKINGCFNRARRLFAFFTAGAALLLSVGLGPGLTAQIPMEKSQGKDLVTMIIPVEVEPPETLNPNMENQAFEKDEAVQKQLDYLLKIPEYVDVINRTDFFKPFHRESKEKIAAQLRQAAQIEPDECHKQYLDALAAAVLEDTFHILVPEWFNLENNKTEILFLPDENHIQRVFLLKQLLPLDWPRVRFQDLTPAQQSALRGIGPGGGAGDEYKIIDTFIYVNDEEETRRFEEYTGRFNKMHDNLKYQKSRAVPYTALAPAIKIARAVYSSTPHQVSLVYPPPDMFDFYRDYPQKTTFKVVIFKNIIDAYVRCVLEPIGREILEETAVSTDSGKASFIPVEVDGDSYLSNLVMYRIAHHMGPVFTLRPKKDSAETGKPLAGAQSKPEMELALISESMGAAFPMAEELKSRIVALYNTPLLIEEGLVPREKRINIYAAYLAALVDRVRQDPKPSNLISRADMIQFNYLLQKGAITFNIGTKKLSIHLLLFQTAVEELAKIALEKTAVFYRFNQEYGQLSPELTTILSSVKDIPLNTEFQFINKND